MGNTLQIRKPRTLSRGTQLIAAIRGKATSHLTTNDIMQLTREECDRRSGSEQPHAPNLQKIAKQGGNQW